MPQRSADPLWRLAKDQWCPTTIPQLLLLARILFSVITPTLTSSSSSTTTGGLPPNRKETLKSVIVGLKSLLFRQRIHATHPPGGVLATVCCLRYYYRVAVLCNAKSCAPHPTALPVLGREGNHCPRKYFTRENYQRPARANIRTMMYYSFSL